MHGTSLLRSGSQETLDLGLIESAVMQPQITGEPIERRSSRGSHSTLRAPRGRGPKIVPAAAAEPETKYSATANAMTQQQRGSSGGEQKWKPARDAHLHATASVGRMLGLPRQAPLRGMRNAAVRRVIRAAQPRLIHDGRGASRPIVFHQCLRWIPISADALITQRHIAAGDCQRIRGPGESVRVYRLARGLPLQRVTDPPQRGGRDA